MARFAKEVTFQFLRPTWSENRMHRRNLNSSLLRSGHWSKEMSTTETSFRAAFSTGRGIHFFRACPGNMGVSKPSTLLRAGNLLAFRNPVTRPEQNTGRPSVVRGFLFPFAPFRDHLFCTIETDRILLFSLILGEYSLPTSWGKRGSSQHRWPTVES